MGENLDQAQADPAADLSSEPGETSPPDLLRTVYGITVGGIIVDIRDLAADDIQGIARAAGVPWWTVVRSTVSDLQVARAVITLAFRLAGEIPPAMTTTRQVMDAMGDHLTLIREGG